MAYAPMVDMNSLSPTKVMFLHPVGISTFKYGVTIPLIAQTEQMKTIPKGGKEKITILCGNMEPMVAEIRRLNNKAGHLQIRYENKPLTPLRDWLTQVFGCQTETSLLEVEEVAPFIFHFRPIPKEAAPCLQISDMLTHQLKNDDIVRFSEIEQIRNCLSSVEYDCGYSQSDYNGKIRDGLVSQGWNREQRVVSDLGLKCDFENNGVWVEVEFGNARSYYHDYVKFMMARKYRNARLGLLLCPTTSFASLLCELGRQRARENVVREREPVYSGMMSYEKAAKELPYLGFMFEMPILVAGVGVRA